jgi:hypothetical protein
VVIAHGVYQDGLYRSNIGTRSMGGNVALEAYTRGSRIHASFS